LLLLIRFKLRFFNVNGCGAVTVFKSERVVPAGTGGDGGGLVGTN